MPTPTQFQSGHGIELYTHALVQIDNVGGYLWELDADEVKRALDEIARASIDGVTPIVTFHPKDGDYPGSEFTFVGTCKGIQRLTSEQAKAFSQANSNARAAQKFGLPNR